MKCVSCGAELRPGMQACPSCGVFVQNTGGRSSVLSSLLIIAAGAIALPIGVLFVIFFLFRAQFRDTRVYQESLAMARASSDVQKLLGEPIDEGWGSFVEMRHAYGADFSEWTALIKGPKGHGRIHGVANRVGPTWHYSTVLFSLDGSEKVVDLTPPEARDKLLAGETEKKVFLVPLGTVPPPDLDWAPAYYKAKFGLSVEILPAIPLDDSVWNPRRHQVVAEDLTALMKSSLAEKVRDQSAILIGLTTADMYIRSFDWRYAINYRDDGRFGVVSMARLTPQRWVRRWNRALEPSRVKKMITKNVYLLCFDVPLSNDSTSAVNGAVSSPEDVDTMSDDLVGAEGRWDAQPDGMAPTISAILSSDQPAAWNMDWREKPPADVSSEYFGANLWNGFLIESKTEFDLSGKFPVQFVRAYYSGDGISGEFGVGTYDSFDISLAGVEGQYLLLTLENGVQTRFDRDPKLDHDGKLAYRNSVDYLSPFSQGIILMRGYDCELETTDGWHYFFPYRATATAEDKYLVLAGYSDPQGRRFDMVRDKRGELLRFTTPAGKWLNFEHDEKNRFRKIEDSEGRAVSYDYDSEGRLVRVSDSQGNSESYRYDEKNRMVAVLDGRERILMTAGYAPDGKITRQTLADGREFRYEYSRDKAGRLSQIRFTDPRGYQTLFDFIGKRCLQSLPSRGRGSFGAEPEPFLQ